MIRENENEYVEVEKSPKESEIGFKYKIKGNCEYCGGDTYHSYGVAMWCSNSRIHRKDGTCTNYILSG